MVLPSNETPPLSTYETLLIEAVRNLAVDSGIVTTTVAAGANTLADSTKKWLGNVHRNRLIKIITGVGAGQSAFISANSPNGLVINGKWVEEIRAGATYIIVGVDDVQALADALGGGTVISATNPLPVDFTPGQKVSIQIVDLDNLAAGATSTLEQCIFVDLRDGPGALTITVVATFNGAATLGLRFHVRTSTNGIDWDNEDWDTWLTSFMSGDTIRETEAYATNPMFIRVLIENLDAGQAIRDLAVHASVGA